MRLALATSFAILSAPLAAQTDVGTELIMRPVTVGEQSQIRGRFGDKWQAGEVQMRAAETCASAGMRLVYFQPEDPDSRGRREFAAVCQ